MLYPGEKMKKISRFVNSAGFFQGLSDFFLDIPSSEIGPVSLGILGSKRLV